MRIRVGIVVLVVLGGILFFATRTGTQEAIVLPEEDAMPAPVLLAHSYAKGVHTITGERTMPTPCDTVAAEAVLREDGVIEVRISETASEGTCLLRKTAFPFSAEVEAPEEASVVVVLNGESVEAIVE